MIEEEGRRILEGFPDSPKDPQWVERLIEDLLHGVRERPISAEKRIVLSEFRRIREQEGLDREEMKALYEGLLTYHEREEAATMIPLYMLWIDRFYDEVEGENV